jgi:hypothetical protein
MSDKDKDPENGSSGESEIESPIDGPPPDWMRTMSSGGESSLTEENTPDWLKSIRKGHTADDSTSSKSGSPAASSQSSADDAADDTGLSDLERLLAEEGIDLGSVDDERPDEAAGMSVKDWMIATSDDEMIRKRIGEEAIIDEGIPPAPTPKPSPPAAALEPEPVSAVPTPVPVAAIDTDDDKMVVQEDLPDWLRDDSSADDDAALLFSPEPVVAAAAEDEGSDKLVVEGDLPDWLREVSEVEEAPAVEALEPESLPVAAAQVEPADGDSDKMVVDGDLPDWLREVSEVEEAPAVETLEPESLPAVAAQVEPADGDSDKMVVEGDLPDWLREVSDEASGLDEVLATPAGEIAAELEPADSGDMPDWLKEVSEEATSTTEGDDKPVLDEDLPDWLQGGDDEAEEAVKDLPFSLETKDIMETAGEIGETIGDEDLPDWLRDVEEGSAEEEFLAAEVKSGPAPTSLVAEPDSMIEEEEEEDLPDWLNETPEGDEDAGVEDGGDLPDWLKDVQLEDERLESEPITPLERVQAMAGLETEAPDEADLPDWLRQVQAVQDEREGGASPVSRQADDDDLADDDDMPDWLHEVAEEGEPFEPSEPDHDDFLTNVAEEEVIIEEELPDWPQDIQEEREEVDDLASALEAAGASPEPAVAAYSLPIEDVIPEPEPVPEPKPTPKPAPPAPAVEDRQPQPAVAASTPAGVPDWLKKLREGDNDQKPAAEPRPQPAPAPVRVAQAAPEPQPVRVAESPSIQVASIRPEEADDQLRSARDARDAENIAEAIRIYNNLVSSSLHLDKVIDDIQQLIKSYPSNPMLYQVMGDAMLRDGRLQSALETYRQALLKL